MVKMNNYELELISSIENALNSSDERDNRFGERAISLILDYGYMAEAGRLVDACLSLKDFIEISLKVVTEAVEEIQ